ncbi:MAG: diguanylate cyclase [Eubacteriales bacterium]|nr:diguanylate cyclase [Eubacteriales bacterium]
MMDKITTMDHQQLMDYYKKMEAIATRDALTGLLNRGALEQQIAERLEEMEQEDECALFIIDLDNFKTVNDTLGHQTGDHVLERAARLLAGMFRAADIVGRLGGDEFVVFLYGPITEMDLRARAQMICEQLNLVMGGKKELCVTASVGIHTCEGRGQTFEQLYHYADLALYQAKKSGKQCYCIWREEEGAQPSQKVVPQVNAVRLKGLLDYMDSGVAMIEMKESPTFLYISPIFARMLQWEESQLLSVSIEEVLYSEDSQQFHEMLQEKVMKENQAVSHVIRVRKKTGALAWWRIHAVRVEYNENTPAVLVTATDISDLKEEESSLRENNHLFQMALSQNMQGIWEVELSTKTFRMMGGGEYFNPKLVNPVEFPEGLMERGWIAPESMEEFRTFSEEIYQGQMQGYGNFRIKYKDEEGFRWTSCSYRMVLDEKGYPDRAVGIVEVIDQDSKGKGSDAKGTKMPDGLMDSLEAQVSINLSADRVISLWIEGQELTRASEMTFDQAVQMEWERMHGVTALPASVSREGQIQAYEEQEKRWRIYEYQRKNEKGQVHWVSTVIHLYKNPKNEDIYLAAWISRIGQRREWEQSLGVRILRDPMSRMYTSSTVGEMAGALLQTGRYKRSALILMEISGFVQLYAADPSKREKRWRGVLSALTLAAGTACIQGQCKKDQFIFFYPEVDSQDDIRRRMEQVILFVRNFTADLVKGDSLRFLAGGTILEGGDKSTYDMLLRKAEILIGSWRNASGDRIAFTDEEDEKSFRQLLNIRRDDKIRMDRADDRRPLCEREKNAAFECLLSMINADSLGECSRKVLSTLGEYYEADRAYILVLVESNHIVTMPHEWTSRHKISVQQAISGTPVRNYPLLMRSIREQKAVFLKRKNRREGDPGKKDRGEVCWRFSIFPMDDGDQIQAYLCIENPRSRILDAALPPLLGNCLLKERSRYLKNLMPQDGQPGGMGMDIPNFSAYMETIYSFHSDAYHTLGVVCLDVPNLSVLNERQGFLYGRKLLWFIIQNLTEIFGRSMLFRTWDAEFVALCPNCTQQVFLGKCARLRAILTRRYPKEVRIGHTWSEHGFNGKTLADEARDLMRRDKMESIRIPATCLPKIKRDEPVFEKTKREVDRSVALYLQPRLHKATGELAGVKALLKVAKKDGTLIDWLPCMEEMNSQDTVRDMDLLVLDKAMAVLDGWRRTGICRLPLSICISEETLFHRSALASFLAVQSRYPEVSQELLEIEIAEERLHHHWERIQEVTEDFREYGIGFTFAMTRGGRNEERCRDPLRQGCACEGGCRYGKAVSTDQFVEWYVKNRKKLCREKTAAQEG